nr:hypothetical protein [Tanacetum cinerariifolium]
MLQDISTASYGDPTASTLCHDYITYTSSSIVPYRKALLTSKYVGDILKKFRYSDVRSANTPMDKENPWGKDRHCNDVELYLYRSMIGSLTYLTASRLDIMFAVCACARHQVTLKECHLHAVKRIFRYLKGHHKLGLWYPKEYPFDLVAYSDCDYGGATQDRKSTTGDISPASESSTKKKRRTVVITTKDMQKRRNDVKARTTLLLALLDEHQLRFSKLQAIMSHLEFMNVEIEQDDLNQKFLTSLALEWLMYTIVWRNRDDLDIISLDDVYNHLKVYEPEVQKKSESNSQNMAFISSSNTSSGKAASLSHDTVCTYIASQSNGSQIKYKDITQIDEDDIEEMDIKWNMALLSMRADRKNLENLNTKISKLNEELRDCETDLYHYKRGLSHVKARLVEFKEHEIKFCEKIRGLKTDVEVRNNKIEYLMNELEQVKKEKEGLDNNLTGFESASKDLDNLFGSQRSDKNKEGLGYNDVPPPPAQVYSPPKKDLSWTGLPEFVDDTVTDYSSITSKPMIKFVKAANCPRVIKNNNTENARKSTLKYAEMYRNTSKSPNVRDFALLDEDKIYSQPKTRVCYFKNVSCDYSIDLGEFVRKNIENLNTKISKLNEELSDCETDLHHYKRGLSEVEARLVEFKEHEINNCEKNKGLERDVEVRNNKIEYLMNELEQVKKEKEGLDNKLTCFESASKDLDNLLGSQISDKNKEGLGYNAVPPSHKSIHLLKKIYLGQVDARLVEFKEHEIKFYEKIRGLEGDVKVKHNKIKYLMKELEQVKKEKEGLPEFVDDTVTDYSKPTPSIDASKCNTSDLQSINFFVFEHGESLVSIMSKPMIKFVKAADCPRVIKTINTENSRKSTVKYAEIVWVEKGKTWPKNNFVHKRMTPKVVLLKPGTTPIATQFSNGLGPQRELILFLLFVHDNPHNIIDDKGYWDSGCSRHMTRNISYLSEYEPYDGGYFSHGQGNPWGKDGPGKDVELHLYRSMIGSLMSLTASRPDIMFAVCACARHHVLPKECQLYVVMRIFRYLKGHPKLGLWYPKEYPFDLVAYSDSDYGGATQDRKSTTGGCQFRGRMLILWQCKKQTIIATSPTKAEYVAAASGCGQVLWIQN